MQVTEREEISGGRNHPNQALLLEPIIPATNH